MALMRLPSIQKICIILITSKTAAAVMDANTRPMLLKYGVTAARMISTYHTRPSPLFFIFSPLLTIVFFLFLHFCCVCPFHGIDAATKHPKTMHYFDHLQDCCCCDGRSNTPNVAEVWRNSGASDQSLPPPPFPVFCDFFSSSYHGFLIVIGVLTQNKQRQLSMFTPILLI